MFECPAGTYSCNNEGTASCSLAQQTSPGSCFINEVYSNVLSTTSPGNILSGSYCYPSGTGSIGCVPSLKSENNPVYDGCKPGYTRCDDTKKNCTVGPPTSYSTPCVESSTGNLFVVKDVYGMEIPGARCHLESNTACRPFSEDCGASGCQPPQTCVSELTNVCKTPPPPPVITCNPPCENNAHCMEDPKNPGNGICDCTTAFSAITITDCFGTVSGSPDRDRVPYFNGPTCGVASLPDGFVLASGNLPMNTGVVSVCNAITNGLVCADGTNYQADSFFYQCKNNDGTCPTDNRSIGVNAARVCGEHNKGFEYTGINHPNLSGCDIGVCDESTIPKKDCNPPCIDPVNQICTVDLFVGNDRPYCFSLTI